LKLFVKFSAAIALLAGVASAAQAPAATYPAWARARVTPEALAQRLVAAHNAVRAGAGTPALNWDASLAAGAQAYAQQLAAAGAFQHSDRRARPGIGENLWMGTSGAFSPDEPDRFAAIVEALRHRDYYMVSADFDAYYDAQRGIDSRWRANSAWSRASILNVARMAWFSSDRTIREYAEDIWDVPVPPDAQTSTRLQQKRS